MSYILLSLTEDHYELRIEDYDIDSYGFPNERVAENMLRLAKIDFPERRIWVEELKDRAYYTVCSTAKSLPRGIMMKTKINHLAVRMLIQGWYEENEVEDVDSLVEEFMTTKEPFMLDLAALHLEYAAKDRSWYLIDYFR